MTDQRNFEVFQRRAATPQAETPTITITSRGLTLNKPAWLAIGRPRSVDLLFDRDAHIIGVRPAAGDDGFTVTAVRDGGGGTIAAQPFLRHIGYVIVVMARRLPATVQDGVLCADLNKPGAIVTSNRAGTGRNPR